MDPVEAVLLRVGRETEADRVGLLPKHFSLGSAR